MSGFYYIEFEPKTYFFYRNILGWFSKRLKSPAVIVSSRDSALRGFSFPLELKIGVFERKN